MSHLPPRPDYSYPPPPSSRFDSRHPPPTARPPPEHGYPRDREPPYGRSPPPRSRYPGDRERMKDSYIAPPDSYMPREPYPPGPPPSRFDRDRRDDDRYRRDRDRDYPPARGVPDYRDRYRDEPRDDPRAPPYYGRPRRDQDSRPWTRREEYERRDERRRDTYEPARERDRERDRERPRPYPPRRSASPRPFPGYPLRRGEPSSAPGRPRSPPPPRRRTPSPRRRTRSPGEYSRSPRSQSRSLSPNKPHRLAPPSIPVSPRYRVREDERPDTRRPPPRRFSRSRTRSPVRSPRRRAYSRSRSPIRPRGRSRSRSPEERKRVETRARSPSPPAKTSETTEPREPTRKPSPARPEQTSPNPEGDVKAVPELRPPVVSKAEEKWPQAPAKVDGALEVPAKTEPVAAAKAETKAEEPAPAAPPQFEEDPLWKVEDTKQLDKDGVPLIEKRGILLPESYWQYVSGKAPLSAAEYAERESDRYRDIQLAPTTQPMRSLVAQLAPLSTDVFVGPPLKDVPEYVKAMANVKSEDEDLQNFDIPSYESWCSQPHSDVAQFLKQINSKIDPLFQRRAHLESERLKVWRESNQALLDLEIAVLDVKAAERRRQIASEQLDLAMEGRLGTDYDHSKPSISDRLDAASLSTLTATNVYV